MATMQGRFKWCGACWVKGSRNEAVISFRGLPLCADCEEELDDDIGRVKTIKEKWEAMPATDSGPAASAAFSDVVRKTVQTPKENGAQPGSLKIGNLKAVVMATSAYVAKFGALRSKGMRRETMELWERLQVLPVDQCLVIEVPEGTEPLKMRASLSNTIQRLIRLNKPPYRISIGANHLKRLVVIAKESALSAVKSA